MEEMSSAVAMPLSISSSMCDNSAIATHVEITRLKLVTDAANLLSDPVKLASEESNTNQVNFIPLSVLDDGVQGSDLSNMLVENGDALNPDVAAVQESEEDEVLSVVEDTNGGISEALLSLEAVSDISLLKPAEIEDSQIVPKAIIVEETNEVQLPTAELLIATVISDLEMSDASELKASAVILKLPSEENPGRAATRSVFELDCIPLWGSVSICGRRAEMEDAVAAVPRFAKLPIKMLIGNRVVDGVSETLTHLTSHFFGVYDGHGGPQVANYCRDQVHLALAEELGNFNNDPNTNLAGNVQLLWERAFTDCFQRVDDEVGGKDIGCITHGLRSGPNVNLEPIAPETVGSTAVVALVCSSHIIVANCGDSRAVLCRGKEAMALSVDHKPNREVEYARIEASGGKVIQWNGHRVFGVLAMSRSIGDRYFKPWIIPEPEIMFVPRAKDDECLILASDGLWDVMTNEEACEVARRKILLWHKKNGVASLAERGSEVDPAAQAAADHLSMLALQKGSKDNISVIVVDLKAQRKFKSKS